MRGDGEESLFVRPTRDACPCCRASCAQATWPLAPIACRIRCSRCGYAFCWVCSDAYCGQHFHEQHAGGTVLKRVAATSSSDWHDLAMRIAALVNLYVDMRDIGALRVTPLYHRAFCERVLRMLGARDRDLGVVASRICHGVYATPAADNFMQVLAALLIARYMTADQRHTGELAPVWVLAFRCARTVVPLEELAGLRAGCPWVTVRAVEQVLFEALPVVARFLQHKTPDEDL